MAQRVTELASFAPDGLRPAHPRSPLFLDTGPRMADV